MWNYYVCVITNFDCEEVWWRREMNLAFENDEEGVEGS